MGRETDGNTTRTVGVSTTKVRAYVGDPIQIGSLQTGRSMRVKAGAVASSWSVLMSRMLERRSNILTHRFRGTNRSMNLDKFPSACFFFQHAGHSNYQFFFHTLPLEIPDLARVKPSNYVAFLYVEVVKFNGEVFCASYMMTIIIWSTLASFNKFVFISAYFGEVGCPRHKINQLLSVSGSECVKISVYGFSSVQTLFIP